MREKIGKHIDKICFMQLLAVIVIVSIFGGSILTKPLYIVECLSIFMCTVYILFNIFVGKKTIIIKEKMDVAVYILSASVFVPLLFKSYVSYSGTLNLVAQYITCLSIYILARNIINTDVKKLMTISTILLGSFLALIINVDCMTFGVISNILNLSKISATFPNMTIIIIGVGYIICIYRSVIISKTPWKVVYNTLLVIFAIDMYMTGKYIENIIIFLLAVTFVLLLKDKNKKLYASINIIATAFSILGYIILEQFLPFDLSLNILIAIICITIINVVLNIVSVRNARYITFTQVIKFIIRIVTVLVILFIYIIVAEHYPSSKKITNEEDVCIYSILPNVSHEISISITAKNNLIGNDKEAFGLSIIQNNKYDADVKLVEENFDSFSGNKQYDINLTDNCNKLIFRFNNRFNQVLKINWIKIDGKQYYLNYKYIPGGLLKISNAFKVEKINIMRVLDSGYTAINVLKDNMLAGQGGGTWYLRYQQKQNYMLSSNESSSNIIDIYMNVGIIGLITYVLIIAIIIEWAINYIKEKDDNISKLFILIVLIYITFTSFIASIFNLMSLQIILYLFISFYLQEKNKNDIIKVPSLLKHITVYILIITFGFVIYNRGSMFIDSLNSKHTDNLLLSDNIVLGKLDKYVYTNNMESEIYKKYIENELKYINQEPYNININDRYKKIYKLILSDNSLTDDGKIYAAKLINHMKSNELFNPCDFDKYIEKLTIEKNFADELGKINDKDANKLAKELYQYIISQSMYFNELATSTYRYSHATWYMNNVKEKYSKLYADAKVQLSGMN